MNKGLAIGVTIGIAIAAIAGAYAFFGVQPDVPPEGTTDLGVSDKAEVTVQSPSEAEEESSEGEEEELEIKDLAEVEVEKPENVTVTAKESVGFVEKVP